jgi:pimeloyl-ACP methyl ester carboxylesterase
MPYADVNGLHMYYEIEGEGRPTFLLHGSFGSTAMFGPVRAELAKGRTVIAVDMQGHGRTADIDRPLDLRSLAGDIVALIEHLNVGRSDVMGFSLGAGVALFVAILRRDLVRKVVACSPILRRDAMHPEVLDDQPTELDANAIEAMKQTPMYRSYVQFAPRVEDFPRLLGKVRAFVRTAADATRDVALITAPVLIVQGDSDIVPPSHAVELFGHLGGGKRDGGPTGAGIPDSHLAILPFRTHYNIFASPELARVAIQFLDAD